MRLAHLQRHTLLVHSETKLLPHECSHEGCEKRFALPHQLKRHSSVHEKEEIRSPTTEDGPPRTRVRKPKPVKNFVCNENGCTFVAHGKRELAQHGKEVHPVIENVTGDQSFLCTEEGCEKVYTRKSAMLKHVQTAHHDLRPFVCPMCQSAFGFKNVLQRHTAKCQIESTQPTQSEVQNEMPNADDVTEASNMILGMLMNLTGVGYEAERPFACPNCRSRFLRQYDLDRHHRTCQQ